MRVCKHWYALAETPALWRALALDRSLRMAPAAETRQVARLSHTDAAGQRRVQWRAVAAERYRLRRNWLAGRCTVRTFVGHTQSWQGGREGWMARGCAGDQSLGF